MHADVELGGTDQKFNLLVGRELQRHYQQTPQIVITLPLLEGLDGEKKMSKSLQNYIGITENPDSMFGKIMSISDTLMWRYLELLSFESKNTLTHWQHEVSQGKNPRDIKIIFAKEIVTRFHNKTSAEKAHQDFLDRFQKHALPENIPEINYTLEAQETQILLPNLLKNTGLAASTGEARRLIQGGGIKIDEQKISDVQLSISKNSSHIYQIGKLKITKIIIS
jgi:tyrosyl-tRNA synthetase